MRIWNVESGECEKVLRSFSLEVCKVLASIQSKACILTNLLVMPFLDSVISSSIVVDRNRGRNCAGEVSGCVHFALFHSNICLLN